MKLGNVRQRPLRFLSFRVGGVLGIAGVCLLVPAVGENRFLLAAILVFVAAPTVLWLNIRFGLEQNGWSEPGFDLILMITLVHLVPDAWYAAFCIGLMIALAPSVSLHPKSVRIYTTFAIILIGGMSFAAVVHDVQGWVLPILVSSVIYPTVVFYARWQSQHAQELRERAQLLQSLTLLAGSVAHDFNNILVGVTGHAELALLELGENHPAASSVKKAISGAQRASLLGGQLLAFSGRSNSSPENLELKSELDMIAGLMDPVVPKGVHITLEAVPGSYEILGNRSMLQQVVMNVILNAGESSEEFPSAVEIKLRREELDGRPWIVIQVRDHGSGIPRKSIDKVFDPLFSSKQRGHGFGLASAPRIMKSFGGSIDIESEEGVGTLVSLRFPETVAHSVTPSVQEPVHYEHAGLVLVVDDEPNVREVAGKLLEHLTFEVESAENADEALKLFARRKDQFAAVILDLQMPGKDGWECLAELRAVREDIPVVICSGYDPEQNDQRLVPPYVSFLRKPFRLAELDLVLQELMSNARTASTSH